MATSANPPPDLLSWQNAIVIQWMDEILHLFEAMVEILVCWYLQGNHQKPGLLRWYEMDFATIHGMPTVDPPCLGGSSQVTNPSRGSPAQRPNSQPLDLIYRSGPSTRSSSRELRIRVPDFLSVGELSSKKGERRALLGDLVKIPTSKYQNDVCWIPLLTV